MVAGFPRSPCYLNDPQAVLLPAPLTRQQPPRAGDPATTPSGLELPPGAPAHPCAHQLLWLLHFYFVWVLILLFLFCFNFCVAVRKLPIITALRGNVSWHRPCSQLWPPPAQWLRRARGLQEPPAQIMTPSKVPHFNDEGGYFYLLWRGKYRQENPNQSSQRLLQHILWPTAVSAGRDHPRGGRAANRLLDALFYHNSDKFHPG